LKAELSKAGSALEKAEEKQIRAQSKQFSLEAEKAKITELQKALTTVRIANIQRSAVAIVAKEQGGLLEDARIADLHTQDAALATSFPANSPTRMAIRAQIDTLAAAEMQRRQADQQVSEVQERLLTEELNVTLAHATETQNEIETFKREVASARRVYEELQERLAKAQLSLSLENR
jgi:hypothetical protein